MEGKQSTTVYTLPTRELQERAKPPRCLQSCTAVACAGLVYCLAGFDLLLDNATADVRAYNPGMDSWVAGPAFPAAVQGMQAAEHGGCVYACGGLLGSDDDPPSAALLMLDPRTRAWASLPPMPIPVACAGAAVVAGRMYVPGGQADLDGAETVSVVQCYDVAAGCWDTGCAPLSVPRSCHCVAVMHGEVWAVGGEGEPDEVLDSVEVFSPQANTWRAGVPLPSAAYYGACAVLQC